MQISWDLIHEDFSVLFLDFACMHHHIALPVAVYIFTNFLS